MESLNTGNQLVSNQQYCFQRELASTVYEEVFERRTKKFNSHDVIVAFLSEPYELGESGFVNKILEKLSLFNQLGPANLFRFLKKECHT